MYKNNKNMTYNKYIIIKAWFIINNNKIHVGIFVSLEKLLKI